MPQGSPMIATGSEVGLQGGRGVPPTQGAGAEEALLLSGSEGGPPIRVGSVRIGKGGITRFHDDLAEDGRLVRRRPARE